MGTSQVVQTYAEDCHLGGVTIIMGKPTQLMYATASANLMVSLASTCALATVYLLMECKIAEYV